MHMHVTERQVTAEDTELEGIFNLSTLKNLTLTSMVFFLSYIFLQVIVLIRF